MGDGRTRVLAGRYELGPIIGRGGMADVYRGRDRTLERDVAVKLVANGASTERFLAEARRTAQIRHPAIVEVYDVGVDQDAFLVMALLDGESLHERLERERSVSAHEAVTIGAQICDALGAAHALGVVHRDIKPGNVFLPRTKAGTETQVKVLDFGVAKRIDGSTAMTDPGVLVGTAAYLAPELIRGDELDGRADLYALGVVLYRCLYGRLPFDQDNMASLIHAHLNAEPPRLPAPEGRPEFARLDLVVRRLLSKSAADRPEDAAAARAALLAALEVSAPAAVSVPELGLPATLPERAALLQRAELPELDPAEPAPLEPAQEGPISFELDHGQPPLVAWNPQAFSGPRPLAPIEHGAYAPPPPRGLLASIPTSLSKRVAGYAAVALVLYVVFFPVHSGVVVVLGAIGAAGLIAYLGATRA